MSEDSNATDKSKAGIYIGGDLRNNSGQIAIGEDIHQIYTQSPAPIDIEKLKKCLIDFKEELSKIDIPSDDKETIKNDITAALIEAGKEEPKTQKIKSRVENVIETLKETVKTAKTIAEIFVSLKTAANMLGINI
jgi:hypothetical protein